MDPEGSPDEFILEEVLGARRKQTLEIPCCTPSVIPRTYRVDLGDVALFGRHWDGDGERADVVDGPGFGPSAQGGVGGPWPGGHFTQLL